MTDDCKIRYILNHRNQKVQIALYMRNMSGLLFILEEIHILANFFISAYPSSGFAHIIPD